MEFQHRISSDHVVDKLHSLRLIDDMNQIALVQFLQDTIQSAWGNRRGAEVGASKMSTLDRQLWGIAQ